MKLEISDFVSSLPIFLFIFLFEIMLSCSKPRHTIGLMRCGLHHCLPRAGITLAARSLRTQTRRHPISAPFPLERHLTQSASSRQLHQPPPERMMSARETTIDPIGQTPPLPTRDILDKVLPGWAAGAKPYLLLTRIDKPIGSILLFWPCGEYFLILIMGSGREQDGVKTQIIGI